MCVCIKYTSSDAPVYISELRVFSAHPLIYVSTVSSWGKPRRSSCNHIAGADNASLLGGSGVDSASHHAAGPQFVATRRTSKSEGHVLAAGCVKRGERGVSQWRIWIARCAPVGSSVSCGLTSRRSRHDGRHCDVSSVAGTRGLSVYLPAIGADCIPHRAPGSS